MTIVINFALHQQLSTMAHSITLYEGKDVLTVSTSGTATLDGDLHGSQFFTKQIQKSGGAY